MAQYYTTTTNKYYYYYCYYYYDDALGIRTTTFCRVNPLMIVIVLHDYTQTLSKL